jgi:hypothetical protein
MVALTSTPLSPAEAHFLLAVAADRSSSFPRNRYRLPLVTGCPSGVSPHGA